MVEDEDDLEIIVGNVSDPALPIPSSDDVVCFLVATISYFSL